VRSTTDFEVGQEIKVGSETRKIANVGTSATTMTTIFVPVSTGPWVIIPVGATNLPVTSADGFEVGEKIGIDMGGNYEEAIVTEVGRASTQSTLVAEVAAGTTKIRVASSGNIAIGDTLASRRRCTISRPTTS
jgi:hypothetical protein